MKGQCFYQTVCRLTLVGLVGLTGMSAAVIAAPKTTTFDYDALGRLTFVNDSQNGNRDYDYDPAGNRLYMSVGASSDGASQAGGGAPAKPQNLSTWGPISYYGGYTAQWDGVTGATHYIYRTSNNSEHTITAGASRPSVTYSSSAVWVKACNSSSCSNKAYF